MQASLNEIDDMIVHEKMQAAMEYQHEAWADGMADGIAGGRPPPGESWACRPGMLATGGAEPAGTARRGAA